MPTFVPDAAGSYVATLEVSEGSTAATDSVCVTAGYAATAAVAVNPIAAKQGNLVTLDGSPSTGTDISHLWSALSVPSGATTPTLTPTAIIGASTFTPTTVGTYQFKLKVSNAFGADSSVTVSVVVTAPTVNLAPVFSFYITPSPTSLANGSLLVSPSTSLQLTSSSTDSDGTIVSYAWYAGADAIGSAASVYHTPTATTSYKLTATDNQGASATSATLTVYVAPTLALPTSVPASGIDQGQLIVQRMYKNFQAYLYRSSGNLASVHTSTGASGSTIWYSASADSSGIVADFAADIGQSATGTPYGLEAIWTTLSGTAYAARSASLYTNLSTALWRNNSFLAGYTTLMTRATGSIGYPSVRTASAQGGGMFPLRGFGYDTLGGAAGNDTSGFILADTASGLVSSNVSLNGQTDNPVGVNVFSETISGGNLNYFIVADNHSDWASQDLYLEPAATPDTVDELRIVNAPSGYNADQPWLFSRVDQDESGGYAVVYAQGNATAGWNLYANFAATKDALAAATPLALASGAAVKPSSAYGGSRSRTFFACQDPGSYKEIYVVYADAATKAIKYQIIEWGYAAASRKANDPQTVFDGGLELTLDGASMSYGAFVGGSTFAPVLYVSAHDANGKPVVGEISIDLSVVGSY